MKKQRQNVKKMYFYSLIKMINKYWIQDKEIIEETIHHTEVHTYTLNIEMQRNTKKCVVTA